MTSPRLRILLGVLAVFCAAAIVAAIAATSVLRARERDTVSGEQKLARTLEIIHSGTPTRKTVLKVLFYGQSITKSGWHKAAVEHWRQAYPNTVFVVENRALGGFPAQALVRSTEQDVAAFYPDLIVFHDYGDHRAYEEIIRLFRSRTAADILVQTDHGETMPEPRCEEGLHFTLTAPPGCKGFLWYRQRVWNDEMSYHKIPEIARKYGLAVEPQRDWWREYLLSTGTPPQELLIDDVHPNEKGKALIAEFFNRYFDGLVSGYRGQTAHDVADLEPTPAERASGQEEIHFDGSRLELVSEKPLPVWPSVTVDGEPPASLDGCYLVSRASPLATVPDWPAIRRITLIHDRTAEAWSATLTGFSPDQKSFVFSIDSSRSGPQGSGSSGQPFVSRSGNLRIDPGDWQVERAWEHSHVPLQAPYRVTWSVDYQCGPKPETIDLGQGATQYRYVLAAGLPDSPHTVRLKGPPEDFQAIDRLIAYTPRIRDTGSMLGW